MIKKVISVICSLAIGLLVVGCANNNTMHKNTGENGQETVASTIGFSIDHSNTSFEISIAPQNRASAGGELWEKDDEIRFTITKSNQNIELEVGICPVREDNTYNYDKLISKMVEVGNEEKEIIITVPETGKYGICFINKTDKSISFEGKTNKKIENPSI